MIGAENWRMDCFGVGDDGLVQLCLCAKKYLSRILCNWSVSSDHSRRRKHLPLMDYVLRRWNVVALKLETYWPLGDLMILPSTLRNESWYILLFRIESLRGLFRIIDSKLCWWLLSSYWTPLLFMVMTHEFPRLIQTCLEPVGKFIINNSLLSCLPIAWP